MAKKITINNFEEVLDNVKKMFKEALNLKK